MKRLFFAVAVLMLVASPACAELCAKCAKLNYTQDVGTCKVCGGGTSSGAFKLCRKCSAKLGQCEHCRAALGGAKARPARGAIIDLHKSGSYNVGRWRYVYTIGAAGSRSEGRVGTLTYDDKPIPDVKVHDRIDTPWGMMQFFGPKPHRWGNGGWLLKQCYDRPIDPKKGRLLPEPGERKKHVAAYKKGLQDRVKKKGFSLQLNHYGGQGKPFYHLMLAQQDRPGGGPPFQPFYLYQAIDEGQALKIIDHLEESGYLESADYWGRRYELWRPPKGPCYVLHVPDFHGDLGWGLPCLKRLDALRTVLEGDAAKKMDLLLGRLSGLRKAWQAAEEEPRK